MGKCVCTSSWRQWQNSVWCGLINYAIEYWFCVLKQKANLGTSNSKKNLSGPLWPKQIASMPNGSCGLGVPHSSHISENHISENHKRGCLVYLQERRTPHSHSSTQGQLSVVHSIRKYSDKRTPIPSPREAHAGLIFAGQASHLEEPFSAVSWELPGTSHANYLLIIFSRWRTWEIFLASSKVLILEIKRTKNHHYL
jgi:hypothetical protein